MTDTASLESIFLELNALMVEQLAIDAESKKLDERISANKARLAELAPIWRPEGGKSLLPGVTERVTEKVKVDYTAVLSWATADNDRMGYLASVLTASESARYVIVERAKTDPTMKAILEIDKKAYDEKVRSGEFNKLEGIPPALVTEVRVIGVTPMSLKTGADLRKALGLAEIAPTPTVESVSGWEATTDDDKSGDVF